MLALVKKERLFRVLPKLVAENTEAARGVAKLSGGVLRGKLFDKVGTECLVLPMGHPAGGQKGLLYCC